MSAAGSGISFQLGTGCVEGNQAIAAVSNRELDQCFPGQAGTLPANSVQYR